ncbi:hypothetical protein RhiJN_08895 [Ceratobasidium sp. AG-Ba]|nr:hypothetical protein RhiJN_08895 [Ceratobasidium sp. AG-Ba]
MISVQLLRDAIQKAADESDSDWIQFSDIGTIIEHIAALRMSAIYAGLREDEDLEIEVEGRRTTLLAYKKRARERLASRVQRRAERGVHSITNEMSRMEIQDT